MAVVLLLCLFPGVLLGLVLGIVYHPWFFLLLLCALFAIPHFVVNRR
jgi:hypothetical protein